MTPLRYDFDFSRRKFLSDAAKGFLCTGVLMPLWQAIADSGDVSRAYPDELLSIENYTKGKIKTGDEITSNNVEYVKELLEPIRYEQIVRLGRKLKIVKTTTDVMRLSPWEYIEATLKNAGKARFDTRGNVVTGDGQPWIGGNPFPDPKNGVELFAAQTMNWGRHDASFYAMKISTVEADGSANFNYEAGWAELSPVGRVTMDPKPYWPEHKDKLRFQSVFFLTPEIFRGTSFLNIWDYDQSTFPLLRGQLQMATNLAEEKRFQENGRLVPEMPTDNGVLLRKALLSEECINDLVRPLRDAGWSVEVGEPDEKALFMTVIASHGDERFEVGLLYSCATANELYKKLAKACRAILYRGAPYLQSQYAYGIDIHVGPVTGWQPPRPREGSLCPRCSREI